ncbi:hypothetical protein EK21DRAFT_112109 [Setomelanomma holmii]|uniref:TLC domain-containing protein n=1 Tax=Setomelanomma holmii TaxID=210430 RepID=A0A9P4HAI9_9PLEO|nr:hypothetical protein EK21DRAFT_112109 [Setomelanomma holmii]
MDLTNTTKHISHDGHNHVHGRPHVTEIVNEQVSILAPYSGLILTISLVIYFLARYYLFEGFLLRRMYGDTYLKLNDNQRRGFINHHVAASAKIIMLVCAAYPFFAVVASTATLHTPYAGSKIVTLGDVLLVLNQVFVAMYIFELIFREKLSYVAVLHHIGSVVIASSAVAISVGWEHDKDATLEFILCYVWGMFDVIAEFWPHVAIILYRMRPKDHDFLRKVFFSSMVVTFTGTVVETIAVMYIWGWAWDRWTLAFKVVTPILHVVFSCAQLWGAYNFYKMWKKQKQLLREKKPDVEATVTVVTAEPKTS